jgi:integrating conjugative element protein (TIGR03755 family)
MKNTWKNRKSVISVIVKRVQMILTMTSNRLIRVRKTMKNIQQIKLAKFALILGVIFSGSSYAQDPDPTLPRADDSTHSLLYKLGGGKVIPAPGSGFVTHRVTARLKLGFGYSCGEFDFHDNVAQMINQIEDKAREIPMQLQNAISAAVAGLPGYLMQKINPNLYNIVTKSLDETAELFRFSYKTCEQMEAEMRQGKNPYDGFMTAVVANKWEIGAKDGENIADTKEEIADDPTGPIEWLGGNEYGTANKPIQINHDLAMAGYNIMLGRTGDVSTNEIPAVGLSQEPIVKIWSRPSIAGEWIQDVGGDMVIITAEKDVEPDSITGKGLRKIVTDLEPLIREALDVAVDSYDFSEINEFTSLTLSNGLVEGLRSMPLGERLIFMERLVSEMAVNEAYERVTLIRQMLLMGLKHPDNVAANISDKTEEYIRGKTFSDLDIAVDEIYETLALKRTTVNSTALSIINQHSARQTSGIASETGIVSEEPTLLDGGIPLD